MSGTFIISLDCEGKWGFGAQAGDSPHRSFTNEQLETAYKRIVELLGRYDIHATFAFVSAFTLSEDELQRFQPLFDGHTVESISWLSKFRADMAAGQCDGWLAPRTLETVQKPGVHEIAGHGFTHLPLAETENSSETFDYEMQAMIKIARYKGIDLKTFVYPRNLIAHAGRLRSFAIEGYRAALDSKRSRVQRIRSLAREVNLFEKSQHDPARSEATDQVVSSGDDTLVALAGSGVATIPPGYFLNWRVGLRRLVPSSVTVRRFGYVMSDAAECRGVAHLWTHPHNFITGSGQYRLLDRILKKAAQMRDRGLLVNLTQAEYCEQHREPALRVGGKTVKHSEAVLSSSFALF